MEKNQIYDYCCNVLNIRDTSSVEKLIQTITIRHYKKGELVIIQNEISPNMYFVYAGLAMAYVTDEEYKDHTLLFASEGEVILSMEDWDMDSCKAFASWVCLEDSIVLAVPIKDAIFLANTDLTIGSFTQRLMVENIKLMQQLLLCKVSSPRKRIAWFYSRFPALVTRLKKQHIADFLGMDKSTYSRTLKRLREEQILDFAE